MDSIEVQFPVEFASGNYIPDKWAGKKVLLMPVGFMDQDEEYYTFTKADAKFLDNVSALKANLTIADLQVKLQEANREIEHHKRTVEQLRENLKNESNNSYHLQKLLDDKSKLKDSNAAHQIFCDTIGGKIQSLKVEVEFRGD